MRELQNALRNLMLGLDPGLDLALGPVRARPGSAGPTSPASRREPDAVGESSPSDAGDWLARGLPAGLLRGTASLRVATDWYVDRVLSTEGGNLSRAARTLGVDRTTLARRLAARRARH